MNAAVIKTADFIKSLPTALIKSPLYQKKNIFPWSRIQAVITHGI